jgi:hypothetical protein
LTYWLGDDAAGGLILPKRVNGSPSSPIELAAAGLPEEVAAEAEQSNLSVRGAVSIQVYGLNRIRLVQERARLIQRMRFLEILAINLGDIAHTLEQAGLDGEPAVTEAIRNLKLLQGNILSEMRGLAAPEMPYSTLAAAYLADFKERLSVSVLP